MLRQFKITQRFILTISIAIAVVFTANFILLTRGADAVFAQLEETELFEVSENILNEISSEAVRAEAMAALVADIPTVQTAFADRDRETLLELFDHQFDALMNRYGVRQFQFHLPPATSFLRIHKPEAYGDDLSASRHSVVQANRQLSPVRGLEVGTFGLGVRGIVPIINSGKHLGSVEFGLSVGQEFIENLAKEHELEIAVYLNQYGSLSRYASSHTADLLPQQLLTQALQGTPQFELGEHQGAELAVYAVPLMNFNNKAIGVLVVGKDRGTLLARLDHITNNSLILMTLSALALAVLSGVIAQSIARPIIDAKNNMEEIAKGDGDLSRRLKETGHDEITELARGYNAFVDKIEKSVRVLIQTTQELSTMVEHFSQVSDNTRRGTSRQQDQITQVASAMTEMSATVHEVAQNTELTAEAARKVDIESNNGQQVVRNSVESINRLAEVVDTAVDQIRAVERDSQQIGSVLDVIKGIAEQTNLLALNAAIEAARAGDKGRGFAVVADEVRNLAQRTQSSTAEIQAMIERLQNGVHNTTEVLAHSKHQAEESVARSAEVNRALEQINTAIDSITGMSTQIATATEEQSAVAEDINRSIIEITEVSQSTDRDAYKAVEETQRLARSVDRLVGVVKQFKIGR